MSRTELINVGRSLVTERLESLQCTVEPGGRSGTQLEVRTPTQRALEVFVSTQRVGGYAFWTQRRLHPASTRFAAIALLDGEEDPALYLVPSTEWLDASRPLTNRPNVGKKSEAEYGVSLARSSLPALQQYSWDEKADTSYFR